MASAVFALMIMIWVIITVILRRAAGGNGKNRKNVVKLNRPSQTEAGKSFIKWFEGTQGGRRPPRSTDGHVLGREQDITCRRFGHNHSEWEEPSERYIVHDDIEDGYIILNGKKMHRTEADQYENSI